MEWVKLGDIADINSGGTPRRSNLSYWKNGNIPWIKISDLKEKYVNKSEEFITDDGLNNSSAKMFVEGTILYTIFATIGEAAILKIPATTNQAIAGINITNDSYNVEYIYYYLLSIKEKIKKESRGVAQNNINLTILKNLKIPSINKLKQNEVVNTLKQIEKLIEIRKEQIQSYDDLIESLFFEMFKKYNTKSVNLGDLFELKSGSTPSRKNNEYWNKNDIPWIKSNQVNNNFIFNTEEYISQEGYKNSSLEIYPEDTVLIAMYGQGKTRGQVGILKFESTTNQAVAALIPNKISNMTFIFYLLKTKYEELRGLSQGGNQKNLSLKILKNFKIFNPPIELQNKFADYVIKIEEEKKKLNSSLKELGDLFDALMQDAFSGNLFKD
ncbi:hypothetical protein HMPREF3023_04850 [Peptoniphilus sp. HMSC075B08]|uniref:restriction endonuclease subunit S n=1 Tax=Peptoniphilus sp. HMSC075B08 TaxID=1739525 RepID=UPI0008A55B76|nr:restriction endonuclease subunit S [Peptoniphilus sp. HMSC075B08]OFO60171.1 hypothetical protein HMPREF3023_04850 [Peptoniphilus sp. HMSC075B08]